MRRRLRKGLLLGLALLVLGGCFALDREDEVRAQVGDWVFLAQTRRFVSKPTCTVAIFDVVSEAVRSRRVTTVSSLREGLRKVGQGRTVAFDLPGQSPNAISEGLMSLDLSEGLGLLSSFVGPSRSCMDDAYKADVYRALMSPETLTVYDPGSNALLLLHRPTQILFFMRGNV
jgi:hypothetical protein